MWESVKEKIDQAAQILMEQMEASGKPYPADVYLLWNDLAFLQYVLDVKVEYWGAKER
jgi:hypothetical protein